MRSILALAIFSVVSNGAYAETASVQTLRVSGAGACVPYHVSYSPDTSETLIDFAIKPFDKVQVVMRNKDDFEKKVQATPYGGLFSFKGSYDSATVQVGKCTFSLSHAPQVNKTHRSIVDAASNVADEVRMMQIQQQMDKLIAAISQANEFPKEALPIQHPMPVASVESSYPIGVIEKPVSKVEPITSPKLIEPTVVPNDEWQLVKPMTAGQPLKSWKFEKDRNSVLIELEKGRGYEVISAKNMKGIDQYKGKINDAHRVLLPYMSDDKITLEIKDLKSNKFVYFFEPPESLMKVESVQSNVSLAQQEVKMATDAHVQASSTGAVFTEIDRMPREEISLELKKGQYLSNVLERFVEHNFQWKLTWLRQTDILVNHDKIANIKDVNALAVWLGENTPLNVLTNVKTKQLIVTE